MSHQSDSLHKPCGQIRCPAADERSHSIHTQLMERRLTWQLTIEEPIRQLMTRHLQQDLVAGRSDAQSGRT